MRPSLLIKTLFRAPLKTFLTFSLLAVVTFALFSRVAEYTITNREIKHAAEQYHGTGSVEISKAPESYPDAPLYITKDPRLMQNYPQEDRDYILNEYRYQPLSQEQIGSISKLPYITASSTRYMTSGVSDQYWRLDEGAGYYYYSARFIVEGTLSEVIYDIKDLNGEIHNNLRLEDCTLLAGNPSWLPENKKIEIYANSLDMSEQKYFAALSTFDRVFAWYDNSYAYGSEYIKNLALDHRYVFVGHYEPISDQIQFFLGDYLTNPWCKAIQPVEGQPENYLETGQFAPLRELIEMSNSDLHTFDVVYTDDMSSIMRFAKGDMALESGRGLTREDNTSKSNVCVVSREFAAKNKLGLGNKITLKLGTELFEQYKGLGAVAAARERYSPPDKTVELEIVGIYIDTDGKRTQLREPHWNYSKNTVFVPKSLLPLDESKLDGHMFSPAEFSFTVGNAWDISSFVEQATPLIKKMGLSLVFYDDGWPQIADEFIMSAKLSVIAIIAFSGAVIAAIGFIVFLFIGRKKKEYAIMRALGTTKKESAKALILPLMALSLFAVFAGSCSAWVYTTITVARSNNALSKIKEYAVDTSIPLTAAAGCILGEILLLLFFVIFGLWRMGAISPLMLLQSDQNKQGRGSKPAHDKTKLNAAEAVQGTSISPVSYSGKNFNIHVEPEAIQESNPKRSCAHVQRYIIRHIRRSAAKSMLAILLSALLFGAVGQFAVLRQSHVDLCNSVDIKAKFMDGLQLASAIEVAETDYIRNVYYEYTGRVDVNNSTVDLAVTNDIARYTGEETEITFADGYDESSMNKLGEVCIAGSKWLAANGLEPGDKIHVTRSDTLKDLQDYYVGRYRRQNPDEKIMDGEILESYNDEITKEFMNSGSYYTIAGVVTTHSDKYSRMLFSPGDQKMIQIFRTAVPLDLAEFTLADNLRAYEFRVYAARVVSANADDFTAKDLTFYMDTSKLDELIKALTLLDKLFPAVVAAAVLIGAVLCGLIIIQMAKETAILRVLGTTRRRAVAISAIEQVILCLAGLAAGALGLFIYNGAALSGIVTKLYLFAALYFAGCLAGTLVCSLITTRRKVLELLQTKE